MKWQKNTGVMPCDNVPVIILMDDGSRYVGKADQYHWGLERPDGRCITHYCILDVPEYDYVEPKVWTVEDGYAPNTYKILKNGSPVYAFVVFGERHHIDHLADALNAMEERNGTV